MADRVPRLFLAALTDLTGWLHAAGVPAMVVGGVAASILGRPRAMRDIDALAVASDDQWAAMLATAMAMPDLLDGLEKLLAQRKSRPASHLPRKPKRKR